MKKNCILVSLVFLVVTSMVSGRTSWYAPSRDNPDMVYVLTTNDSFDLSLPTGRCYDFSQPYENIEYIFLEADFTNVTDEDFDGEIFVSLNKYDVNNVIAEGNKQYDSVKVHIAKRTTQKVQYKLIVNKFVPGLYSLGFHYCKEKGDDKVRQIYNFTSRGIFFGKKFQEEYKKNEKIRNEERRKKTMKSYENNKKVIKTTAIKKLFLKNTL